MELFASNFMDFEGVLASLTGAILANRWSMHGHRPAEVEERVHQREAI
jgi:hypothetical protein